MKNHIKYRHKQSRGHGNKCTIEVNREDREEAGNISRCLSLLAANCDVMVVSSRSNSDSNSIGDGGSGSSSVAVPLATTAFFWRIHTRGVKSRDRVVERTQTRAKGIGMALCIHVTCHLLLYYYRQSCASDNLFARLFPLLNKNSK